MKVRIFAWFLTAFLIGGISWADEGIHLACDIDELSAPYTPNKKYFGSLYWSADERMFVQAGQGLISTEIPEIKGKYARYRASTSFVAEMPYDFGDKNSYKLGVRQRGTVKTNYLLKLDGPGCTEVFDRYYLSHKRLDETGDQARVKWDAFMDGILYLVESKGELKLQ